MAPRTRSGQKKRQRKRGSTTYRKKRLTTGRKKQVKKRLRGNGILKDIGAGVENGVNKVVSKCCIM